MALDGTGNSRRLTTQVPVRRPSEEARPAAPKPAERKPAERHERSSFTPQNPQVKPGQSAESSSLLTENSRDGKANCLDVAADWVDKATPALRARSEMVFLKDSRPGAEGQSGHVVIRQGDRVVDPSSGKNYDNLQAFLKEQPHYQPAGTLSGNAAAKIFAAPPGSAERQRAISEAKVPDSLQRMMVADSPQAAPTTQAPAYSQADADRDAASLYDAMEGGVTGWGTDEDKIFKTLEGKTPEQINLIRKGYKDHYGKDMDSVIRDELSGADEKHAMALLQGDPAKSAAVQVQAELDGVFGSNEDLLKVLEKQTPEQRQATAQKFAEMNGGLKPGQSAQDFMLDRLGKELNPEQLGRARNMLAAGQSQTPEQKNQLEAQAIKDGLKKDMDGWGTDEDRIFERLEKATPEQRKILAQDEALKNRLKDELGTEDFDRAMGLMQDNPAKADAARLTSAMNGFFGADESGVRSVLEGKKPEELERIKAEYQTMTGKSLEDEIRKWDGADKDVTLRLLNPPKEGDTQGRADAAAEKLKLAVDGAGTDEDAIRNVLKGKSKAEINDISAAYQRKYGEDLRSRLDSELSGRDHLELVKQDFDLGAVNDKDPGAAQERVRRLREQQANESGFGTWVLDNVQRGIKGGESDNDRLNRTLGDAERAIQSGDTRTADRSVGFATDDVKSLQSSKDSLAEGAATAAVVVATTAAVVATGGAATPLALAGYAALGATTRAATYELIQGGAAGWEDAGRQALIGAVEGGTVVLPVTKGASIATTTAAKSVATTAGREVAENTVLTAARQGVKEGVVGGAAGGAVDAATRSETWQNGLADGLTRVAEQAATGAVIGGTAGGLTSAGLTKALQPKEIPVVRNPELTGNTAHVRYDDGRVRVEVGPNVSPAQLKAHMDVARELQKFDGPLGKLREMKSRLQEKLTGMPGYGSQGFESQLEVKKLKGLIGELEKTEAATVGSLKNAGKTPESSTELARIRSELDSLNTQLRAHETAVDSLVPARGYVAAEARAGAERAKANGWPDAEKGYYWTLRSGQTEPQYIRSSSDLPRREYDTDLGKFVNSADEGPKPPKRFEPGTTAEKAFDELGGNDPTTPFGKWVTTMENAKIVPEGADPTKSLRENIIASLKKNEGALAGATHDNIRHGLKGPYKDKLLDHITNPAHLETTQKYQDVLARTGDAQQALRAASHDEMLTVSNGMAIKEQGNLAEAWYLKTFGTQDSSTQVSITQDHAKAQGVTLEKDRFADQVEVNDGTVRELKNVYTALGPDEKKQFGDLVKIASQNLQVKAKVGDDFANVEAKSLVMSFLDPRGVKANTNFMKDQLEKLPDGAPVKFEIFNANGERKFITQADQQELGTPAMEAWLKGEAPWKLPSEG
ncbi:annexin [Myxococcus stipitatus]|uniref:annexin n=1 Tax=Myxococcus stipitatus TaxID=83455 RepID=UPI00314527C6